LEEQRRANDVAEWNLRLVVRQAQYGLAQTVATALAFIAAAAASGIAWRAMIWAKHAAKETKRSADATSDQLEAVRVAERAYLIIPETTKQSPRNGLLFGAFNFGRTHAHIQEIRYVSSAKPPKSPNLEGVRLQKLALDRHIPNAESRTLEESTALGPKISHVIGYIRYTDVYMREHRTYFRYDLEVGGAWKTAGGSNWNRTT
jgi:hypothetical protein